MRKGQHQRKDKLIKRRRHRVYGSREKWPDPTLCTKCEALYSAGRWTWSKPSGEVNRTICPACRRIASNFPAGYIEIKGDFFEENRDEILNLIRNIEKQQKEEHPLERIMSITDEKGHTLVLTTGVHIARRIGEALSRSYQGEYSIQYADGEKKVRVYWQR